MKKRRKVPFDLVQAVRARRFLSRLGHILRVGARCKRADIYLFYAFLCTQAVRHLYAYDDGNEGGILVDWWTRRRPKTRFMHSSLLNSSWEELRKCVGDGHEKWLYAVLV